MSDKKKPSEEQEKLEKEVKYRETYQEEKTPLDRVDESSSSDDTTGSTGPGIRDESNE